MIIYDLSDISLTQWLFVTFSIFQQFYSYMMFIKSRGLI